MDGIHVHTKLYSQTCI